LGEKGEGRPPPHNITIDRHALAAKMISRLLEGSRER
jgi:hypothetical protein